VRNLLSADDYRKHQGVVILNGGEATVRDRTNAGRADAANKPRYAADASGDLLGCTGSSGRRKVPRAGEAAAQDDITFEGELRRETEH